MKSATRAAMKTLLLSPQSMKSSDSRSSTAMEESQSYYFPGCRKDANCSCEICLDSINATLDLMPMSVKRTSLTRFSSSKPVLKIGKTPISIDPTLLSTPTSRTPSRNLVSISTPTPLRSTAKTVRSGNGVTKKKKLGSGLRFFRWVLLVGVIFVLEFGFSFGVSRVLRPKLSREIVKGVIENSLAVKGLSERLTLIQLGLEGFVDGEVSRCNLDDSIWTINQDGLMLRSQCTLYKSAAEEVTIWGWPLQTSGLLISEFSAPSFTVLSGRVTQWPEGKMMSMIREVNATWGQTKWSASAVQLDPNSWVIEYKESMFLENPSVFSAAIDFLEFGFSKLIVRMKHKWWRLPGLRNHCFSSSMSEAHSSIPT